MHKFRFLNLILLLLITSEWLPSARASDDAEVPHVPPAVRVCACGDHDCALTRTDIPHGRGSSGRWKDTTTPKRNWHCADIEDKGEAHIVCQMCKREEIRYAHLMRHTGFPGELEVGCICAGYMEGILNPHDSSAPTKIRENWVKTRSTWKAKIGDARLWKKSRTGADYFPLRCRAITSYDIYVSSGPHGGFAASARIKDSRDFLRIAGWHTSREDAVRAAFDVLFPKMPA